MKIRTFTKLENGVCRVSIHTEDWSEGDRGLMARFGEPEIDLGGAITDGSTEIVELDSNLVRVMSESPFAAAFDSRDYADDIAATKAVANAWIAAITERISSAVTALRLRVDGFTGERVEEV